jgi:hypothetical protein
LCPHAGATPIFDPDARPGGTLATSFARLWVGNGR